MDPVEPLMWLGKMLPEVESNNHIKHCQSYLVVESITAAAPLLNLICKIL